MSNKYFFLDSLIKKYKILVCDFDGVFVDSINLKRTMFRKIIHSNRFGNTKKIINHHLDNQHLDRFEKIKIYYYWIYGYEIENEKLNFLANKFGNICNQLLNQKNLLDS